MSPQIAPLDVKVPKPITGRPAAHVGSPMKPGNLNMIDNLNELSAPVKVAAVFVKLASGKKMDKEDELEYWWEEELPSSQKTFFNTPRTPGGALYIIRHGKTKLNSMENSESQDRIRGWMDVPLDDTGEEQAEFIAEFLKHADIKKLYCSDLNRAHTVARVIGTHRHLPLSPSSNFRPWNLGTYQGKTTKRVMPELEKYIRNKPYPRWRKFQ